MKKFSLVISLFVILALLTACGGQTDEPILTIGDKEYAKTDLEGLGTMSADYTNKDGETTSYTGVSLSALLEDAGLASGGETLVFTASDGYQAEMALADALACANCIVAFDEDILRMVMPDMSSKLQVKDVIEISVE